MEDSGRTSVPFVSVRCRPKRCRHFRTRAEHRSEQNSDAYPTRSACRRRSGGIGASHPEQTVTLLGAIASRTRFRKFLNISHAFRNNQKNRRSRLGGARSRLRSIIAPLARTIAQRRQPPTRAKPERWRDCAGGWRGARKPHSPPRASRPAASNRSGRPGIKASPQKRVLGPCLRAFQASRLGAEGPASRAQPRSPMSEASSRSASASRCKSAFGSLAASSRTRSVLSPDGEVRLRASRPQHRRRHRHR